MKKTLYFLSVLIVIIIIFWLSGILAVLQFFIFIIIYSLIFYFFYFLYKKIRKKEIVNYKKYLLLFIQKICLSFVIISIIIGIFGYYQNYINPATMKEITLSNGKKIIIFQEMSHIGSKSFYNTIKNNLIKYKKQGFVYFFEGVKPGTKENKKKFDKAIGIKFNKDLYKNFGKLYGVSFQTADMFLGLVNNLDFNIDVDIDWIMEHYQQKKPLSGILSPSQGKETAKVIDLNSQIIEQLSKLNNKQLSVLRFINKSILNLLIKSDKAQSLIQENFANKILFDIILNGRNKVLSNEIIKSKYKKIYITYGKLHFPGIFDLLKKSDTNWKILKIKEIKCIY